jgi:hypothetical protein
VVSYFDVYFCLELWEVFSVRAFLNIAVFRHSNFAFKIVAVEVFTRDSEELASFISQTVHFQRLALFFLHLMIVRTNNSYLLP